MKSLSDVTVKVEGGASNLALTFIMVPTQLEWTFKNLTCQPVADME